MNSRKGLNSAYRLSWIIGILGALVSIVAWLSDRDQFYSAWLISWFYVFSIPAGASVFLMIYRLTGGVWGESLERILLAASSTYEALALLFLPVLGGFKSLYPWTHPDRVAADEKLAHKHAYLNIPFWCVRTLFYFAVWILLSRDRSGKLSAFGLICVFLTVTFASVDWIMSLEPLWYSTVYGMLILTGQGISGMAFPLLVLHSLQKSPGWNPPLTDRVLKDQGNLLLTACILWTYIAFVQWLIIWIGNVPETVTWYTSRAAAPWEKTAWLIVIGQFAIPFQLLLFEAFKTRTRNLAGLSAFLLIMHFIEVYWLVVPAFHPDSYFFNWMVFPTLAATGGLWMACFIWRFRTVEPAVLKELLGHE